VFLKLGTTNVHHKRNKMTPLDIAKRKTPFFCILKGLSNKQKLLFMSYAL